MGKKRKKSFAPPATEIQAAPESLGSQPALSEEKAAELVAAIEPAPVVAEPPKMPEPEPTPMIALAEATPTPSFHLGAAEDLVDETPAMSEASPESETPASVSVSESGPASESAASAS